MRRRFNVGGLEAPPARHLELAPRDDRSSKNDRARTFSKVGTSLTLSLPRYEQINAELTAWVAKTWFDGVVDINVFEVAVVGLRVDSEHEDSCCATLMLKTAAAEAKRGDIEATFLDKAKAAVSKGAKPDKFRVADLPKNFKGVVLVKDLAAAFKTHLNLA